jgi:DNA-binding response OmpR family regulator
VNILCVDDEPDIRAILEIALSFDPDIHADIVESGIEALELAATRKYDLIVLDGLMPGLDGYSTCGLLKANEVTANVPVVFLTANLQRAQRESALSGGAERIIEKPFDPMTLAMQLRLEIKRASRKSSLDDRSLATQADA